MRLWGFFHCHHDSEKMALEIQSKHTPLVSDSLGWILNPSKREETGRLQAVHSLDTALLWVLLWAEPGVWEMAQFRATRAKYLGVTDGASQDEQQLVLVHPLGCSCPVRRDHWAGGWHRQQEGSGHYERLVLT